MAKKPLKVGFDLDGVILYNPARTVRPFISFFKRQLLKKKQVGFYVPQTDLEKQIWHLFHKSSIFVAQGFPRIRELSENKKIEPYIITARYNFLKHDFDYWLNKIDAHSYFKGCYHNELDQQPHLYKETLLRRHDIDIFVEDNLDIVLHLQQQFPKKKILWIYNILDKSKNYPLKFPNLNKAIDHITREYL